MSSSIVGNNSLGPREQFTPKASTPNPESVTATDLGSQPTNVLPSS